MTDAAPTVNTDVASPVPERVITPMQSTEVRGNTMTTPSQTGQIALIMVGLPARGKTHTAQKLNRYLRWLGFNSQIFDVGHYRRDTLGAQPSAAFFDHDNKDAAEARMRVARSALRDMVDYFAVGGQVGIYDAANTTEAVRSFLLGELSSKGVGTIFVECICDNEDIIAATMHEELDTSPDYRGVPLEEAKRNLEMRVAHYARRYETITDDTLSYVKLINAGERLKVNNVKGYLPSRIVPFLMNAHFTRRTIILCRDGQSKDDRRYFEGTLALLSTEGRLFSHRLRRFLDDKWPTLRAFNSAASAAATSTGSGNPAKADASNDDDDGDDEIGTPGANQLLVWTSTTERSKQTAVDFDRRSEWKALVDLNPGVCDGLTDAEVQARYPEEHSEHQLDPYFHRYGRAESYSDLAHRIEPVILELERQSEDVMIIAHETVLRCLYGYFLDVSPSQIPTVEIPTNAVIVLRPRAYHCEHTVLPILS